MGRRVDAFIADSMTTVGSELSELTEDERMSGLREASIVEDVIAAIDFLGDASGEADIRLPSAVMGLLRGRHRAEHRQRVRTRNGQPRGCKGEF
ncbi:hypothetical protein [Nocardia xishanensis]